jgi:hypothetical protein
VIKLLFNLTAFIFCGVQSFAQVTDDAVERRLTQEFQSFIPAGYIVFDTATAGFDTDGQKDIAIAAMQKDMPDSSRYPVVLKNNNNTYIASSKCNAAILCRGCAGVFGDPHAGISLSKNVLAINHYGGSAWRWTNNISFRFQNNQWRLIGRPSKSR